MSSAAAVACALGLAKIEAAVSAFEASKTAVILVDQNGKVSGINAAGSDLLGTDLKIEGRRLVSWNHDATVSLDRALNSLVFNKNEPAAELPIILPRVAGRPIIAYPARLPGITDDYFAPARAILVLHDLDQQRSVPEVELARIFKLTRSEARLAVRVCSGETVERVAEELGISYETARSQIKAVLQKTDTHRQAELVAVVSRLA